MEFKEFAAKLKPIIGGSNSTSAFAKALFELMLNDEDLAQIEDLSTASFKSYYNGRTKITKIAQRILPYLEPENFSSYLDGFPEASIQELCKSFEKDIDNITPFNASEKIAYLFNDILVSAAAKKRELKQGNSNNSNDAFSSFDLDEKILGIGKSFAKTYEEALHSLSEVQRDVSGKNIPSVPITPTRFYSTTRTILIRGEAIKLPIALVPTSSIAPHELPYINALCEVYAEKIKQAVSPSDIGVLSPSLSRNFSEQRKAYYSALSAQRSMREVFKDGEKQFEMLKEDAFDGISEVYYDDRHTSGYDRLLSVLEKITNTTLTKSSLMNIAGLIGNLEKKGICHILVNDDKIKSWVNIDG